MTKNIPYLDGWRGLAILCLLVGHFLPVNGINLGTVGVALFFVLSGLLMAKVLFVQQTHLVTFYQRRIARVLPSVAIYLLVIVLFFVFAGRTVPLIEILPAMTFTNNYLMPQKDTMPFGHIWSLSVEEHSYVILSLAAYWCRSKNTRSVNALAYIVMVTMAAIAVYSLIPGWETTKFHLRTEVASFGIFASAFFLLAGGVKRSLLSSPWTAPVALLVGILSHWWSVPVSVRVVFGWGALALAINAMSVSPQLFRAIFEMAWLRQLGLYSFSVYLWQQPYYQFVRHAGMSPWVGLFLAVTTGGVAYFLIEKPARRYLNQLWTAKEEPVLEEQILNIHE